LQKNDSLLNVSLSLDKPKLEDISFNEDEM